MTQDRERDRAVKHRATETSQAEGGVNEKDEIYSARPVPQLPSCTLLRLHVLPLVCRPIARQSLPFNNELFALVA